MSHFLYFFSDKDTYKKEFPKHSDAIEAAENLNEIIPRTEVDKVAIVFSESEIPGAILNNLNNKVREYFNIDESQRTCNLAVFLRKSS